MPHPIPLSLAAVLLGGVAIAMLAQTSETRSARAQAVPTEPEPEPAEAPSLALPIVCQPGATCFIQSHVDHDPGPGARDYRCLGQTYDGHKGTDFRVPTLAEAGQTAVLAAAAGTVRAVRGTVPDHRIGAIDRSTTNGIECGNGVVIDHGGGWETQYCHMRAGSLRVAAGETVDTGQPLGTVGLSGNTQFAHLHFSLRHAGETVDPFSATATPDSCDGPAQSLWTADAAAQLGYTRSVVLNTGFAAGGVTMDAIEAGTIAAPSADSPALVAYARAINLREGDVLSLHLTGPNGRVLADSSTEPMDRTKAQWMLFTGRRLRGDAWPAGRYTARVTIASDGETVLEERFTLTL